MTNKHTKKALFMSALSILLCLSMLIGSTFAWFTDTASTGVNTIVAGNLDVTLEYSEDMNVWKNAETATEVFDKNDLWEPGFTKVVYFRVTNKGSLDLKYKVGTNLMKNIIGETRDKDASGVGKDIDLTKFIQFGIVPGVTAAYDDSAEGRTSARTAVTAPTSFQSMSSDVRELAHGVSEVFAFVAWMPEGTNNDANHDGVNIPSIEFGVRVDATQLNSESDSFGNDYDTSASLPESVTATVVINNEGKVETDIQVTGDDVQATISAGSQLSMKGEQDDTPTAITEDTEIVLSVEPASLDSNVTVEEGNKAETYEISLVAKTEAGDKEVTSSQPIEVSFNIGANRVGAIKLFHKDKEIPSTYNSATGIITFTTTDFSPFTVVEIGPKEVAITTQEELNAAITAAEGPITVNLADGTYNLLLKDGSTPNIGGKNITFTGSNNAVFDLTDIVGATWHTQDTDAIITFDGVTVKWNEDNEGYQGFTNADKVVYKNCIIYGTQFMGGDADFINCVFEAENTAEQGYAVYGRGVGTLTFTGCDFKTDGRAIMLYQDQTTEVNVVMNKCTFSDNGKYNSKDKAVVETGDGQYKSSKFNITIDECTANGFDKNNSTSVLWGNKDNIPADRLNVVINGEDVY